MVFKLSAFAATLLACVAHHASAGTMPVEPEDCSRFNISQFPVKGLSMEALVYGLDRNSDGQLCFLFAAVEKGDARSETQLAHLYAQAGDYDRARALYKRAIDQDGTTAMNELAALDRTGSGLPDNQPDIGEAQTLESRAKLISLKYNAICLDQHLDRVMRLDWLHRDENTPQFENDTELQFTNAQIRHVWGRDEFDCIARFTAKRDFYDLNGNITDFSIIPLIGQFQITIFDSNNFAASLAFWGTDDEVMVRDPNTPYYTIFANGDLLGQAADSGKAQ